MITLKSYACGEWKEGQGKVRILRHAATGDEIARVGSDGVDFGAMVRYGRDKGGPVLRRLHFQERATLLKRLAEVLNQSRQELLDIAASYGATAADAAMDVDGGIATVGFYASLGSKKLPPSTFLLDGEVARLSKLGNFVGRHVFVPLEGVVVQINAYNFPAWGMLEKLAPSLLAGMPNIVKPATPSAWLAFRVVELLVGSGLLPEGSLQIICGGLGDLLDHLTCQDVVAFTGSASTGQKIRSHSQILAQSVRVNIEADSLNCIVLGPDARPGTATFDYFVEEVLKEMTVKAGQKCTAIRRVLVPKESEGSVIEALRRRLSEVRLGDAASAGVVMGPLVDQDAVDSAREGVRLLASEADTVFGGPGHRISESVTSSRGSFMDPALLRCREPGKAHLVHEVEVFGPVATVIAYDGADQAIELARRGGGSLVGSLFSEDDDFSAKLAWGLAPYHGRLMVMNAKAAPESPGHGVVMPHLIHGGPGRAGGGEELGGLRGIYRFMHRVALQGDPERLDRLCAPATVE